jgi:acetoin utilization protein AcuB
MTLKAATLDSRPRRGPSKAPAPVPRATSTRDSIETFMTRSPHCIGKDQKLVTAQALMRAGRLRHLPVLEAGKLVGMLSQRDIYFLETIRGVDPEEDTVEDAMTQDAYQVAPSARLHDVIGTMAKQKLGSAVVVEAGRVVGLFTTTDALTVLAGLLALRSS